MHWIAAKMKINSSTGRIHSTEYTTYVLSLTFTFGGNMQTRHRQRFAIKFQWFSPPTPQIRHSPETWYILPNVCIASHAFRSIFSIVCSPSMLWKQRRVAIGKMHASFQSEIEKKKWQKLRMNENLLYNIFLLHFELCQFWPLYFELFIE